MLKKTVAVGIASLATIAIAGCSSGSGNDASPSSSAPACPTQAIDVTVSVNQWGNIAQQLGGQCATVTTIVSGSSGDPHDYEPTTGDIAKFSNAKLVVVNGMGYDDWASKAVASENSSVPVVSAATVNHVASGSNPHLWYNPTYVVATAEAVTEQLKQILPAAASYFDQQAATFTAALGPYLNKIDAIKKQAGGKTYGATESVFDYMAAACGLANLTPQGYQNAAKNESEPSPADIAAFNQELTSKKMNVLIFNSQTEGSVPDSLVNTAKGASVPVVNVTETMPADAGSFQDWQVSQLNELAKALGLG